MQTLIDRKESDHRYREAEEISRDYPFSPEDVYYAYNYLRWDRESTEAMLILALAQGVSPFDMIRQISLVNAEEDGEEGKKGRKRHVRIHQMKLRGLSGHDRDGVLFSFSYRYHSRDHSFKVYINETNARNLCGDLFGLDTIAVAAEPGKWESFMVAILKEVLTVFSRFPVKAILNLEELEVSGSQNIGVKGMEWNYDGESVIELTKPGRISFRV